MYNLNRGKDTREMTNKEKREKVVDELIRRKKVIENHMDMVFKPSEFHIAKFGYCVDMISFIEQTLCNIGMNDGYDYSIPKLYIMSVGESHMKSCKTCQKEGEIVHHGCDKFYAFIAKVIEDINSNIYPDNYYNVINTDWR
nr:MAG TPA: hypothetical protein [Caudoviricetes sp.]